MEREYIKKPMDVKIIQIDVHSEDNSPRKIFGLGDDNIVYYWSNHVRYCEWVRQE